MVAHMQDPLFEFHDVLAPTPRLLWTLPLTTPWHEFRLQYHDFLVTLDPGANGERFQILGAWIVVTKDLLLRERVERYFL